MKKKIAIVLCVLLLVLGLAGCVKHADFQENPKQYTMDLEVGVAKTTGISSSEWDITCKGVTKINYKYFGAKTDNISLMMNSATFTNKMPIDKTMVTSGYPYGPSYGKVEIYSASVNSMTANSVLEGNELKLRLKKPVRNGDALDIAIEYYIKLPQCNMRYGYNNYVASFAQFYPQAMRVENYSAMGDSFYSTADDYVVNIKYPRQYICLASGTPSGEETNGGYTSVTYTAKKIRDFAFFIGLVGNVAKASEGDLTVSYMYCLDSKPKERLEVALSAIKVFSEKYGEYGKSNFAIVATPFAYGGMEYGDIITVNSTVRDNATFNNIIVHEMAHQWWYGAVGSDQTNHAWQDEGLTEFSVFLYQLESGKNTNRENSYLWQTKNAIKHYRDTMDKLGVPIDESMDRKLDDFVTPDEYTYIVYDKSFIMFYTIYDLMGEESFFKAVQDYYKSYSGKLVTPQNLFDTFDKYHSGISQVFNAFLSGKVIDG